MNIKNVKYGFYRLVILIFISLNTFAVFSQDNSNDPIDSIKNKLRNNSNSQEATKLRFAIVETFMDADQYDSAQVWLNKIAETLPIQQASITSYFLSSRQAEIYYYNRLLRLGIQESQQSLTIAKELKDSILLADAYNFLGLFNLSLDSFKASVPYFLEGIKYASQPPYPSQYIELTKPHHLYGNLAEAYTGLGKYDSSNKYARISLKLATEINWDRGIAVALNSFGDNFLKLQLTDSAIHYYDQSVKMSKQGKDFDIELLNYSGLAKSYQLRQNKTAALNALETGFALIKKYPIVNNLFTNLFYDDAISIYKYYNLQPELIAAMGQRNILLQNQIKRNNDQLTFILNASLQNETRLLGLQVQQATQQKNIAKNSLYYLAALIILGVIAFIFYRYALTQKLQKSNLRNRISKDLHDDVGSSLSSLNLYSSVASKLMDTNPDKAKEMLQKISDQSIIVMENISDIVWSMKTGKDDTADLSAKIKNVVADTLSAAEINYKIEIDETDEIIVKSITARRNIVMIVKETINNAVKYSEATHINIAIRKINNTLFVEIKDNGKGFDPSLRKAKGNGLNNMQKRAGELNGNIDVKSTDGAGTTVTAIFPLTALSNVGW